MMIREEAIAELVARDVARWGEEEREASLRMHSTLSHGRVLNALAHYDIDDVDERLAAEAQTVMTAADLRDLRQGD